SHGKKVRKINVIEWSYKIIRDRLDLTPVQGAHGAPTKWFDGLCFGSTYCKASKKWQTLQASSRP
ncbi:hypothetical protein ACJX0J_035732, partial [Zea mays]